ncbi:MAG TPA: VanZ family protein [Usitatibacter sp.]|jgi:VanZ family protein|nr:VanZ family protein [Usitatibacter sp.]
MIQGRFRGVAAAWLLLLFYASLYPFGPLRETSWDAVAGAFARPRSFTTFDTIVNVLAYMPFGLILCLHLHEHSTRRAAMVKAVVIGAAFSLAMETVQLFIPGRVSSVYDILANAAGTLLGALAFVDPLYAVVTRPLGLAREEMVIAGPWGDAGLVLVLLWLIAQLNPGLPFFGAGNIVGADSDVNQLAILHSAAVAMGIAGFGLFISSLLAEGPGSLRATLVLLSVALWLKFMAASMMLQPHFAEEWLSVGRIVGLVAGIAMLVPARRFSRSTRTYLALMLVLAGALASKIAGAYSPLEEFMRLFRWPYGQLANFATMTRFLHELWPFAAVVFLIALFLRTRRGVE